jgi:hypothetical protein
MLKSNLSTRPFYNDRLVSLAILAGLVAGLALTAFNVTQILSLTEERSVYTQQIERDRAEAARIRTAADAVQGSVDQQQLRMLVGSTREANGLIDQRTFSWTGFFETVEQTLPLDARLIAVAPRVERGNILIAVVVVAKSVGDLQAFTEALQNTGEFYDVLVAADQLNDDGTHTATIQTGYLPARAMASPSARSAGRGRP